MKRRLVLPLVLVAVLGGSYVTMSRSGPWCALGQCPPSAEGGERVAQVSQAAGLLGAR